MGEWTRPPFEACDSSVSMVRRNYVPEWCGKSVPAKYSEFRAAFAEYKVASERAFKFEFEISNALPFTCWGAAGFHPADPGEVDLIAVQIGQFSRPAVEQAAEALRTMQATRRSAFAGNPDQIDIELALEDFRGVIEALGRGNIMLDSAGEMFRGAQAEETCNAAAAQLGYWGPEYASASVLQGAAVRALENAMKTTDKACAEFTFESLSPQDVKDKAGRVRTRRSDGASVTLPKSVERGSKRVKIPVSVTSPASGYGTVTLSRGPKGIAATGGQVTKGSFGFLVTIPKTTKEGKVTLTFALEGGPTVKGTIRLV